MMVLQPPRPNQFGYFPQGNNLSITPLDTINAPPQGVVTGIAQCGVNVKSSLAC